MKNIAIYCSSHSDLAECYLNTAALAGEWIGKRRYTLVYGGVNAGMMHIAAAAAHSHGAKITGIIPLIFKHRADPLNDEIITTANLNDRKAKMIETGDLFIVLPGGLGTIDEWISTLTQLCVVHDPDKRIIIANINGIFNATIMQMEETTSSPFTNFNMMERMIICNDINSFSEQLNNYQFK